MNKETLSAICIFVELSIKMFVGFSGTRSCFISEGAASACVLRRWAKPFVCLTDKKQWHY